MDPTKVQIILEWEKPQSVRDVQYFLGFAKFYCKFIRNYSKKVLPLTQLTHKNQPFIWNSKATEAFESLKRAFTTTPILAHVDPKKRFILEADASDFALGSVLYKLEMTVSYILLLFIRGNLKLWKLIMRFTTRNFSLL